jgi:hypothetical protein
MQVAGLVIGGVAMNSLLQTLGETIILFSYFIIFDMTSSWVQYVVDEDMEKRGVKKTEKKLDKSTSLGDQPLECPNLYLQAEDGATFYTVSQFVKDKETVRYITFMVIPAILTFIGLILTRGKVNRTMFG